jgi:hypothetical protein
MTFPCRVGQALKHSRTQHRPLAAAYFDWQSVPHRGEAVSLTSWTIQFVNGNDDKCAVDGDNLAKKRDSVRQGNPPLRNGKKGYRPTASAIISRHISAKGTPPNPNGKI